MARKVFVSYKYGDTDVEALPDELNNYGTCRDYVDLIMQTIEGVEIYKGEQADEDLSEFKKETIRTHLKEKIRDSSITVVLISKGMKLNGVSERDQWIPWEIKYSLLRKAYGEKRSNSNGMLGVVIPDEQGSYAHYFQPSGCQHCGVRTHQTQALFEILRNNMFNTKIPKKATCPSPSHGTTYHVGSNHSYIYQIEWENFIKNPSHYLDIAEGLRNKIDNYKLQKRVLAT